MYYHFNWIYNKNDVIYIIYCLFPFYPPSNIEFLFFVNNLRMLGWYAWIYNMLYNYHGFVV